MHLAMWFVIGLAAFVSAFGLPPLYRHIRERLEKSRRYRIAHSKPYLLPVQKFIKTVENIGGYKNVDMNVACMGLLDNLKALEKVMCAATYSGYTLSDITNLIIPNSTKVLTLFKELDEVDTDPKTREQAIVNLNIATDFIKQKRTAILEQIDVDLSTDGAVMEWSKNMN